MEGYTCRPMHSTELESVPALAIGQTGTLSTYPPGAGHSTGPNLSLAKMNRTTVVLVPLQTFVCQCHVDGIGITTATGNLLLADTRHGKSVEWTYQSVLVFGQTGMLPTNCHGAVSLKACQSVCQNSLKGQS